MQNTISYGGQGSKGGIPISLLLKQIADPKVGEERHKFHPITVNNTDSQIEGIDDRETEYIKDVEHDFSGIAGDILDRLNLAHMRKK